MLQSNERIVKHKVGLLNLAGVEALIDQNRRKPDVKNRVDELTEEAVVAYATEQPAHGQVRARIHQSFAVSCPFSITFRNNTESLIQNQRMTSQHHSCSWSAIHVYHNSRNLSS